jgi:hypothetical protein
MREADPASYAIEDETGRIIPAFVISYSIPYCAAAAAAAVLLLFFTHWHVMAVAVYPSHDLLLRSFLQ